MRSLLALTLAAAMTLQTAAGPCQNKKCGSWLGIASIGFLFAAIPITLYSGLQLAANTKKVCTNPEYPIQVPRDRTTACLNFACDLNRMASRECDKKQSQLCDGMVCVWANSSDLPEVSKWKTVMSDIEPLDKNPTLQLFYVGLASFVGFMVTGFGWLVVADSEGSTDARFEEAQSEGAGDRVI